MTIDETLDGEQWRELSESLQSAFRTVPDLVTMVQYGLDQSLYEIIPHNANLSFATFELVDWAKADGRLSELILAARNAKPGNPRLRRFAETVDLAPQSRALESIYTPGKALVDVDNWKMKMGLSELAVCRIEIGGSPQGTGFLIGSRLVITARHVLDPIWRGAPASSLICRFDYKTQLNSALPLNIGVEYVLEENWLLDDSPTRREGLDFALLSLKEPAGNMPVNNQADAPNRGWLQIPTHNIVENEHLFIIQHPNAAPMKLGVGKVGMISADREHICHDADTEPGSSGSPCFTMDWELIGIHQHGGGYYPGCAKNGAISIAPIVSREVVKQAIG
jgi:hypothetical protein